MPQASEVSRMIFRIEITETLQRIIEINAENRSQAIA